MAVTSPETDSSLPYHEPDISTILVQASFLLLVNIVNAALDRIIYCGLLGQVLLGIAWGTPGARWLSTYVEKVIVQLGYLGLILLVYQGGLTTSFNALRANLLLSSAVAVTGITVPIGLSFSLQRITGATPVQAFAAGAALCSTSLGTTFTVLASSGLSASRLGVVLTSAAMMDDVIGLVMVQVISNLGTGSIGAITVVRPIVVSLAFAILAPLMCRFIVGPSTRALNRYRETNPSSNISKALRQRHTVFAVHTILLIALVAGATFAGTSNLFAAYIAGATISWWDSEIPHPHIDAIITTMSNVNLAANRTETVLPDGRTCHRRSGDQTNIEQEAVDPQSGQGALPVRPSMSSAAEHSTSGLAIYRYYYEQAVSRILLPFFFASIGFSIPITRMFSGPIVWRGFVYAILMALGKLVCGLWLVRLPLMPLRNAFLKTVCNIKHPSVPHLWGRSKVAAVNSSSGQERATAAVPSHNARSQAPQQPVDASSVLQTPSPSKPISLQPPLILALAMTARGEIGFLISAVAESKGVFSSVGGSIPGESEIFLVVTWAIVLCTMMGPLGVGLCVRRVRSLEGKKSKEQEAGGRDVLGVWGVQ